MRSIFTVTPLVSPHFFAQPSRYVSKSATKWLHWRMFKLPLSFTGAFVPVPAAVAAGAVVLEDVEEPTHAAAIGIAAAAAAPLRTVRRLSFRLDPSSTCTSRAG